MGRSPAAPGAVPPHVIQGRAVQAPVSLTASRVVAIAPCGACGGRHDEMGLSGVIWLVAYTSVLV
jgi:hypothetical protein